jgi:2-succinyl-5-enolpyruvyl-6-hydroxy-3-cyclohexene-1-carboxylate synthase
VRVVVIDNGGGGIFGFLPQAEQLETDEFEALLGTPVGLETERVAALYGLPHVRLDDLSGLAPAGGETALIEMRVDRAENLALHRRLTEVAVAAVERSLA